MAPKKEIKLTKGVAKDLKSKLILKQKLNKLSIRKGKKPCYLYKGKALPGLVVKLQEKVFKSIYRYKSTSGVGSSARRGRLLDKLRSHRVDCGNRKNCFLHPKLIVSKANKEVLDQYYNDVERIGCMPITTQLVVSDKDHKILTAVDEIVVGPNGFKLVELKSGYGTNIDALCSKKRKHIKIEEELIPDTLRNRHAIQAALTAHMFKNDYGKIKGVYVCYLDRQIKKTPNAHKLKNLETNLEWFPVHEQSWYKPNVLDSLMSRIS